MSYLITCVWQWSNRMNGWTPLDNPLWHDPPSWRGFTDADMAITRINKERADTAIQMGLK